MSRFLHCLRTECSDNRRESYHCLSGGYGRYLRLARYHMTHSVMTILNTAKPPYLANPPYLLTMRIQTACGKPLPHATIDLWQPNTAGRYYHAVYRLRGAFQADAEGKCEILTVIPGPSASCKLMGMCANDDDERTGAGYFHVRITPPSTEEGKRLEMLTTRIYVCRNNDPNVMDPIQFVISFFLSFRRADRGIPSFKCLQRAVRKQNMVDSWAAPSFYPSLSSQAYSAYASEYSFPPIPHTSISYLRSIDWWNTVLTEKFPGRQQLKVMAGGETIIRLNERPWFYWF